MDLICDLLLDFYEGRKAMHPIEDKILDRYLLAKEISELRAENERLRAIVAKDGKELDRLRAMLADQGKG